MYHHGYSYDSGDRTLPASTQVSFTNSINVTGPVSVVGSASSQATRVMNLFSCSTQLSMKFIQHINVKMPTFISRINANLR